MMRGRYFLAMVLIGLAGILFAAANTGSLRAQPPGVTLSPPGGPPFGPPGGPPGLPPFVTPSPEATPTPLLTPSPTSAAPGCAVTFNIPIGSVVTLRPGVNIRAAASVSSAWLANYNENRLFTVIGGPVCADNYIWWNIRGHGITGWVAERDNAQSFIRFIDPPAGTPVCAPPLVLRAGDEVTLETGVRVRSEPGLQGLVLTVAPIDAVVLILSNEIRCVDGFNWRFIRVTVANFTYEGWMVEGSSGIPSESYIELTPAPAACYPPLAMNVGDRGRVTYRDRIPKNLRTAPDHDADIVYTLVRGVPFEILGGPVCSGAMNWWQVRILAGTVDASGWLAEGGRGNYWIRRTNDVGADIVMTAIFNTPTPTLRGPILLSPPPTVIIPTIVIPTATPNP